MRDYKDLYIRLIKAVALESKDPKTKVGCIIVKGKKLSYGYNGFPTGVEETPEKWERPLKYEYSIHAEKNAIINCPFDTDGSVLYCTHKPCHRCLGAIINAGIKEVFYLEDYSVSEISAKVFSDLEGSLITRKIE